MHVSSTTLRQPDAHRARAASNSYWSSFDFCVLLLLRAPSVVGSRLLSSPSLNVSRMARAALAIYSRVPIQHKTLLTQTEPALVPTQATQISRAHTSVIEVVTGAGDEARE